ncbi:MAG: hypothetical protein Fur0042_15140 [Cyanophyceae cyanobacterium]
MTFALANFSHCPISPIEKHSIAIAIAPKQPATRAAGNNNAIADGLKGDGCAIGIYLYGTSLES